MLLSVVTESDLIRIVGVKYSINLQYRDFFPCTHSSSIFLQLSALPEFILPFLMDTQSLGLTPESAHTLAEYIPILVQIFSGTPDQLTFQRYTKRNQKSVQSLCA